MLKLLFRKKTIPLIVAGSIASLLSGCVEFLSTDKLLIFSEGVLPTSQFDSITGRYQLSEGEYWSISNIDNGLYLEFCSAGELLQNNFILSQVPNQSGLFVQAFPSLDSGGNNQSSGGDSAETTTIENIFFLLKPIEKGFNMWLIDQEANIAQDYFPSSIPVSDSVSSVYPVDEVKDFLVNYGDAYTQANESIPMVYVDNQSLVCTGN